jgi:hypothetical protein
MIRRVAIAIALCVPAIGVAQRAVDPQVRTPLRRVVQAATCLPTVMSVAPGLPEAPPKTMKALAAALQYAESHTMCAVVINLGPATYVGEFLITRPTTLHGQTGVILAGPLRNPSGYELTIENLAISNAPDAGVMQNGGRLTLSHVSVNGTRRVSDAVRSGTAISLHGGANATLAEVAIDGNDGVGLYLDGKGTTVHAVDLHVRKNRIHPAAKEAFARASAFNRVGAVEVASDAELYVDRFDIADNEVMGVLARNRGAAHLRQGTITGTTSYTVAGLDVSFGGTNVMSRNEARIELSRFTSSRAGACGLRLARAYIKTGVKGEVHDNAIGLCIHEPLPGFDAMACVTTPVVRFHHNGTNVDGQTLSVPDPACGLPNPPPGCDKSGVTCPGVPWK